MVEWGTSGRAPTDGHCPCHHSHPRAPPGFDIRKLMDLSDATKADAYDTNIQIADLNALNAIMMVLRWKKWSGFYVDDEREHHSTYTTAMHLLTSDGCP